MPKVVSGLLWPTRCIMAFKGPPHSGQHGYMGMAEISLAAVLEGSGTVKLDIQWQLEDGK